MTTTITGTSNDTDIIDLRDVIARVEELRETREALHAEFEKDLLNAGVDFDNWVRHQVGFSSEDADELASLEALLDECKGNGDDEKWEDTWYPVTLVRDSYFETYAQELADDIGAVPPQAAWPCNCIDWELAARELKVDYTCIEFDGITYWVR